MSTSTTCQLLYGGTLADDAIDVFVAYAGDPKSVTVEQLAPVIRGLEASRKSAGDEIAPYIEGQIEPLETMRARLNGEPTDGLVDFDGFKASGLELLNICEDSL